MRVHWVKMLLRRYRFTLFHSKDEVLRHWFRIRLIQHSSIFALFKAFQVFCETVEIKRDLTAPHNPPPYRVDEHIGQCLYYVVSCCISCYDNSPNKLAIRLEHDLTIFIGIGLRWPLVSCMDMVA